MFRENEKMIYSKVVFLKGKRWPRETFAVVVVVARKCIALVVSACCQRSYTILAAVVAVAVPVCFEHLSTMSRCTVDSIFSSDQHRKRHSSLRVQFYSWREKWATNLVMMMKGRKFILLPNQILSIACISDFGIFLQSFTSIYLMSQKYELGKIGKFQNS
jgi:hypothetical protein